MAAPAARTTVNKKILRRNLVFGGRCRRRRRCCRCCGCRCRRCTLVIFHLLLPLGFTRIVQSCEGITANLITGNMIRARDHGAWKELIRWRKLFLFTGNFHTIDIRECPVERRFLALIDISRTINCRGNFRNFAGMQRRAQEQAGRSSVQKSYIFSRDYS